MDSGALDGFVGTEDEGYLTRLVVAIAELKRASQRWLQSGEGAQERGLAAAVSALHADYLPAAEGESEVALDNLRAVAYGEMIAEEHEG